MCLNSDIMDGYSVNVRVIVLLLESMNGVTTAKAVARIYEIKYHVLAHVTIYCTRIDKANAVIFFIRTAQMLYFTMDKPVEISSIIHILLSCLDGRYDSK